MENFNKNWLVILLVAVIFGMLGFLLGRTTRQDRHERMMWVQEGEKGNREVEVVVEGAGADETEVKTDTIMKDGKQIIIKEVRKLKKE